MMTRFIFISFLIAGACPVISQTVIVNPDGTHTVIIGGEQEGSPKIIVHPNGQHSVVHATGGHFVAVGPDGRHTVVVAGKPASPAIIVHPDGKHSVLHSTGAHSLLVGPGGTHTVLMDQLPSLRQVYTSEHVRRLMPAALDCQLVMLLLQSLIIR